MTQLHEYPRFSIAERDRRWKLVRTTMAAQGIDVIVCPNNTGHSTDFQANCRWLSHVGGGSDADIAVVFPLHDEITAIATSAAPRWPTVQDWTKDVREARRNYGKVAVERLKELNVENGTIGITGLGEIPGTRTPEGTVGLGFWRQIREAFPKAKLVDTSNILVEARYVKSDEEVAALQKSIDIIEEGIKAKVATARPGVKDWEVWAAAQYAMMKNGSEIPVHCNWISGPNVVRTLTRPSHRILQRGDLIINELEANWMGYRSQAVQPVFVEVADPVHKELIKIQREVFETVREMLRPGVTVKELSDAASAAGRQAAPSTGPAAGAVAGLTMHGRGAGDDGPIITSHARDPEQLATQLKENMVFIFKPHAQTANRSHICTWGDTTIVTAKGGRRMGKRPHDLAIAGG
jgi:Xaa-Pro aminopeptidase